MTVALQAVLYFIWLYFLIKIIRQHYFFRQSGIAANTLTLFFLLKVLAGLALTYVYTYYYTDKSKSDIWRYYTDSVIIGKLFLTEPKIWLQVITGWDINEPDVFSRLLSTQNFSHPETDFVTNNAFIIRIISILNLFTGFSLLTNVLLFCFLSFCGFTALYKTFAPYFTSFNKPLQVAIYLIPSVVFWSSGLLKDALIVLGIGIVLTAWTSISLHPIKRLIFLVVGISILLLTKIQIALTLVPLLLLLPSPVLQLQKRQFIILAVIGFAIALFLIKPVAQLLAARRAAFIELALTENAGSLFSKTIYTPHQYFQLFVIGFLNAIIQPVPWRGNFTLNILSGVENWIVLTVCLTLLLRYFSWESARWRVFLFSSLFCVANLVVVGATVPIAGALVHYRSLSTPYFLIAVLCTLNLEKFKYDVKLLFLRFFGSI